MSKNIPFINIELLPMASPNGPYLIGGRFMVVYQKNGIYPEAQNVLKHIVMTITERGSYQTITPFKEVAVFPDDVQVNNNGCAGFFNIDIFEHAAFTHPADYYITCSLGMLVSNTVKVTRT